MSGRGSRTPVGSGGIPVATRRAHRQGRPGKGLSRRPGRSLSEVLGDLTTLRGCVEDMVSRGDVGGQRRAPVPLARPFG
jgi:hypothetical protein